MRHYESGEAEDFELVLILVLLENALWDYNAKCNIFFNYYQS